MSERIDALRKLYGGTDEALAIKLRGQLVECGDALAAQLAELARDFTAERAERVQITLSGVSSLIRQLVALGVRDDD